MKLSTFQTIRSWFSPLFIRRDSSEVNPVLELYYFRGHYQLATADALYSDGVYYRPLLTAFTALKKQLPSIKKVLVLGTGLGSAVQILARNGYHPDFTLVELDEKILKWAMALMPKNVKARITPVCANAQNFLDDHSTKYDLIVVDVFEGRHVPGFVLSDDFLQQCSVHLNSGGRLVLNYMISETQTEEKAKAALEAAFDTVKTYPFHINRVFIATA